MDNAFAKLAHSVTNVNNGEWYGNTPMTEYNALRREALSLDISREEMVVRATLALTPVITTVATIDKERAEQTNGFACFGALNSLFRFAAPYPNPLGGFTLDPTLSRIVVANMTTEQLSVIGDHIDMFDRWYGGGYFFEAFRMLSPTMFITLPPKLIDYFFHCCTTKGGAKVFYAVASQLPGQVPDVAEAIAPRLCAIFSCMVNSLRKKTANGELSRNEFDAQLGLAWKVDLAFKMHAAHPGAWNNSGVSESFAAMYGALEAAMNAAEDPSKRKRRFRMTRKLISQLEAMKGQLQAFVEEVEKPCGERQRAELALIFA